MNWEFLLDGNFEYPSKFTSLKQKRMGVYVVFRIVLEILVKTFKGKRELKHEKNFLRRPVNI